MNSRGKLRLPFLLLAFFIWHQSLNAAPQSTDPILVIAADNHFGSYTAEILKTEGFAEYKMDSLSDPKLSLSYLKQFDLIILAEYNLLPDQALMLDSYVKEGGNLIAFKPDQQLSQVFGITDAKDSLEEGYLGLDTATEIGRGISGQTLQIHGSTEKYRVKNARIIADFYKDAFTAMDFPAIVENDYGSGHAMAFLYNLPQSIALTRQGNFRQAGREMDGITGIRAMDMFTNGWVDSSKNTINQADEQMRILSHGIEKMTRNKKPLPRFWYFPDTLSCLVTLNNDGEDSKEAEFQPQFADMDSMGAKMTLYVKETDLISPQWISTWRKKGFEISGHPNDTRQAVNPDWKTMDSVYKELLARLNSRYQVPGMYTVVNHWFVWCGKNAAGDPDFTAQAEIEEQNGVRLDCNYAHYDNNSNQGHFLGAMGADQGNFNGSGLVMRFSSLQGHVINLYQQLNNVYDQEYMEHNDQEGILKNFQGLMDRSMLHEVYSFICVKAHNAEYFFSKIPLLKMLDYANSKKIPVWTEQELLNFLHLKENAVFGDQDWSKKSLVFNVHSPLKDSVALGVMIPYQYDGNKIAEVKINGKRKSFIVRSVKGYDYAMLPVNPGQRCVVTVRYAE